MHHRKTTIIESYNYSEIDIIVLSAIIINFALVLQARASSSRQQPGHGKHSTGGRDKASRTGKRKTGLKLAIVNMRTRTTVDYGIRCVWLIARAHAQNDAIKAARFIAHCIFLLRVQV